jgi:hypothetical protein
MTTTVEVRLENDAKYFESATLMRNHAHEPAPEVFFE